MSQPKPISAQRFFIVGGAGFIGSHFTDQLLGPGGAAGVTLYDNYSSGRQWHHAQHEADPRFRVVRGEVEDARALAAAMDGHDVVIHLASNPDIARAAREPTIDFTQGTALTSAVVEAMRTTSAKRILYASGSGVYGELGTREGTEDMGPLIPVSTYGASKLAGEALIASYAYMFGLSGCGFRFGNVVGPRQTHGVGFDFARRLLAAQAAGEDPITLRILGDGTQSKSYVLVSDIVRAVLTAHDKTTAPFAAYNVATPATTSPSPRSRRWRWSAWGCPRSGSSSPTPAVTAAGRGTSPSSAWTRRGSAGSAGAASTPRARRCADRCWP